MWHNCIQLLMHKLGFGAEQRVNHFIVINQGAPR